MGAVRLVANLEVGYCKPGELVRGLDEGGKVRYMRNAKKAPIPMAMP